MLQTMLEIHDLQMVKVTEIVHPAFRKKDVILITPAFLEGYKTDSSFKTLNGEIKLGLELEIPTYLFLEFFSYQPTGWTTGSDFLSFDNQRYFGDFEWVGQDKDQEIKTKSGTTLASTGEALVKTVNLLAKSSYDVLMEADVKPINAMGALSMGLCRKYKFYTSLAALVFFTSQNDKTSLGFQRLLSQIFEAFEAACLKSKSSHINLSYDNPEENQNG